MPEADKVDVLILAAVVFVAVYGVLKVILRKRREEKKVMPTITWAIGDVVELKSGGSDMTIASIGEDGRIECNWHDDNGQPQKEIYHKDMLQERD